MGLVLFDAIAVSNTASAPPVTLVADPRYLVSAQPAIRALKARPLTRMLKG